MKTEIIVAVVGITGVLLGATIQYLLNSRAEKAKHYQELRTNAYVDFINGTARLAIYQKSSKESEEMSATVLLTDAKARIAIYGSAKVASGVADFFRKYSALNSEEALSHFVSIVDAMRTETPGGESMIAKIDIGQLIFGKDTN